MTQIGNAYAQGLYDLAKDEGIAQIILEELNALETGFSQEPDFLRLLSVSNLPKEERCRILDDSFRGKLHPYLLNFLKLLTEKGYARHFLDCCEAYREQYNEDNDVLTVTAVTAVAMSKKQIKKLTEKLEKLTGKTVQLVNRVNPECLGGVRLDYDGKRVDGTIRCRLDEIRTLLKNTVL